LHNTQTQLLSDDLRVGLPERLCVSLGYDLLCAEEGRGEGREREREGNREKGIRGGGMGRESKRVGTERRE
jgi:hypothetical protein